MKLLSELYIEFRKVSETKPEVLYIHPRDFQDFKYQIDKYGFNLIPDVHVFVSPYAMTGYY